MRQISKTMCVCLLFVMQLFASIKIIENTTTRCSFRWEIGSIDTASINDSAGLISQLSFSGENIVLGEANEPALSALSVFAGVPFSGAVRVTFTPGETRTIFLNHPVKYHPGKTAPRQRGLSFSDRWISKPRYSRLRAVRAANLVIRPFNYNGRANSVQVLTGGVCTIEFPAAMSTTKNQINATAFDNMLKTLLLNPAIAYGWAKPLAKAAQKAVNDYPFAVGQEIYSFKIGDGHDGMNESTVNENTMVKFQGSQILRLFGRAPGTIPVGQVALYAACKGALPLLAPDSLSIAPGVVEIPLLPVDKNNNARVDDSDFYLCYVTGLNDWVYDSNGNKYNYSVNPFSDDRAYFLTIKSTGPGMRIAKAGSVPGGNDTTDYFMNYAAFKKAEFHLKEYSYSIPTDADGPGWVMAWLSKYKPDYSFLLDLRNLDPTAAGTIRFMRPENGFSGAKTAAIIGNDTLCTECQYDEPYAIKNWGNLNLAITCDTAANNDLWQLDHMMVTYRQKSALSATIKKITLFSPAAPGSRCYRISGLGNEATYIFRVADDDHKTGLVDSVRGRSDFVWSDATGSGQRYFICKESSLLSLDDSDFKKPAPRFDAALSAADKVFAVGNPRDPNNETDFLIIAPPVFIAQALRLAKHKLAFGFSKPRIVMVDDIYADFSGGTPDPAALRNFIAYARRNWTNGENLDYVLLFGSGNYDYKHYLTAEPNYIPPAYQSDYFSPLCTDDFYGTLNYDDLTIAIGRLPCLDTNEARIVIDKIIEVEDSSTADFGPWRNNALFVADDDMQGPVKDPIFGPIAHHVSSEKTIASAIAQRPSLQVKKAFLFEYPWDTSYNKPEATKAIVNEINKGVGYVNYTGHGLDNQWADERVLTSEDVGKLENNKKYPLVSSYACSVAKFDNPGASTLSETLVVAPHAGAIAAYASTRPSGATSNEVLAMNYYRALFDSTAGTSIGMANVEAKLVTRDQNSTMYVLMGDPSIKLINPRKSVRLEIADPFGNVVPGTRLQSLQQIVIKGTVVDNAGVTDASFGSGQSGSVMINFYNPPEAAKRKDWGEDTSVRYSLPGTPIFSGIVSCKNGVFAKTLTLPTTLTYGKPGVVLSAYAWDGPRQAIGSKNDIMFEGTTSVLPYMRYYGGISPSQTGPGTSSYNDVSSLKSPVAYATATVVTEVDHPTDPVTGSTFNEQPLPARHKVAAQGFTMSGAGCFIEDYKV